MGGGGGGGGEGNSKDNAFAAIENKQAKVVLVGDLLARGRGGEKDRGKSGKWGRKYEKIEKLGVR
jgi:hypothetical protein